DLDLSLIPGTGTNGRVTRKDVLNAIANGVPTAPAAPAVSVEVVSQPAAPQTAPSVEVAKTPAAPSVPVTSAVGDIEIPVTGVR
ncbi:branched-chain alpha-keto acid dehydrogenase subunit E2, partial [Pseudomonas sp. GP01-A3]